MYAVRLVRQRVPDVRDAAGSKYASYPARLACASHVATGHSLSFAPVRTFPTGAIAFISPSTSALHANNVTIEFALLLDGLFTKPALALHDSLQPVLAAEDLVEFTEEPLSTIVSVLHAECLIHDVLTTNILIESAPISKMLPTA